MRSPRSEITRGNGRVWPHALVELFARMTPSPHATAMAPHVRAPVSVDRLLNCFVVASVPVLSVGLWNFGFQVLAALPAPEDLAPLIGWRGHVLMGLGLPPSPDSTLACLTLGVLYFLPLLALAFSVALFWEMLFATLRRRPVDPGWLMCSWLFVLLLPGALPPWLLVLGMSFGLVLGKHIFGGTGKYIASPPLLGLLFLQLGYPAMLAGDTAWLQAGSTASSTWDVVATAGTEEALLEGITWTQVFLGRELTALGTGSTLACLAGAAFLVHAGAASHRTLLGALAGLIITTLVLNSYAVGGPAWHVPWFWQLALGGFAFGTIFLATDPTISPLTPAGRWIYGVLIGSLTVIMRVANPAHPDGALPAILMAGLTVPVIDHFVLRVALARRRRRMEA